MRVRFQAKANAGKMSMILKNWDRDEARSRGTIENKTEAHARISATAALNLSISS